MQEPPNSAGRSKKVLASSIGRSGKRTTTLDCQKAAVETVTACFRAAVQVMQETDDSALLARLAGMKPFHGLHKLPAWRDVMTDLHFAGIIVS